MHSVHFSSPNGAHLEFDMDGVHLAGLGDQKPTDKHPLTGHQQYGDILFVEKYSKVNFFYLAWKIGNENSLFRFEIIRPRFNTVEPVLTLNLFEWDDIDQATLAQSEIYLKKGPNVSFEKYEAIFYLSVEHMRNNEEKLIIL